MNNFFLRFVSSIFLFLLLLFLFNENYFIFCFIIIFLLFFALWEFLRLLKFKKTQEDLKSKNLYPFILSREKISSFDFFIIFCIVLFCFFYLIFTGSIFFYLPAIFFLIFLYWFTSKPLIKFFGILYISIPFFILIEMKNGLNFSSNLTLIIYFAVVTDVSSYLVGNLVKGKKIFPKISPGKTISGSIGGIIVPCLITPIILNNFIIEIFFFSFLFAVIIQIGDLIESYLKRLCYVKDSSSLIPGHGGILDRLDGIFLLIISFYILKLFGFNPMVF